MSTIDIITVPANLSLALSFLIGLVFGITQVKAAAKDRKERFTLEILRNFQSREFCELIYYIGNKEFPDTMDEWKELPDREHILFLQFSQEMEMLGILVAERYVDMGLVDKTLGSFVTSSWQKYEKVILDMRVKMPDPFLNEYFQWLAERINERMQKNPRKP